MNMHQLQTLLAVMLLQQSHAQGDLAISLAYQTGNFQWDIGYNFWGRSCEKLSIKDDCCPAIHGQWALKGDQRVYGFDATNHLLNQYHLLQLIAKQRSTLVPTNTHDAKRSISNYTTAKPLQPNELLCR